MATLCFYCEPLAFRVSLTTLNSFCPVTVLMDKKRKRLFETIEAELGPGIQKRQQTRLGRRSVYGTEVLETTAVLPLDNAHLRLLQKTRSAEASSSSTHTPASPGPVDKEKKKTQVWH